MLAFNLSQPTLVIYTRNHQKNRVGTISYNIVQSPESPRLPVSSFGDVESRPKLLLDLSTAVSTTVVVATIIKIDAD